MSEDNKPIDSSYYHGRLTTKGEDAERYKPQLLTTPAEPATTNTPITENVQGSKWNKAQTFETTDFSKQIILRSIQNIFENVRIPGQTTLFITAVDSVTGYASRTFTRGKQCLTFEITAKFTVQKQEKDEIGQDVYIPLNAENSAVIEFFEADFTDLEDFAIKYRNIPPEYVQQIKKSEELYRSLLLKWTKSILQIPDDHDD